MTSTSRKTPDDTSFTSKPSFIRSLTTRTSLITTVAIAGVIVAGGAAIAANIGILSAADSSALGELSATELVATAPESTSPDTTTSTSTTTPAVGATSDYVVDDAGMVSVLASDSGLALVTATANDGWTPALSQNEPTSLTVVFTNGSRTVVFSATLGADGSIVADVTEPMSVNGSTPTGSVTIPTLASAGGSYEDDDSSDDSFEDHDSVDDDSFDDEDEDEEDDEHEYEGADDDD
jgi:hypothetical protein